MARWNFKECDTVQFLLSRFCYVNVGYICDLIWNTRQNRIWVRIFTYFLSALYTLIFFVLIFVLKHSLYNSKLNWLTDLNHSTWNGHSLSLWIVTRRKDRKTKRGILAECHSASTKCSPHLSFSTERFLPGSFNEHWIRWTRGSRQLCRRRKLLISQIHNEEAFSPFAITLGKAVGFSCMNWVAAPTFSLF